MRPAHPSSAAVPPTVASAAAGPAAAAVVGSRHQRLLSGAHIIKSYVHESELRREASKFNNAPVSLYSSKSQLSESDVHRSELHTAESPRCIGKQDGVRLPVKPSTAPADSASFRMRQHATMGSGDNQHEECDAARDGTITATVVHQPLAAFFAGKSAHRARRLSISAAHVAQMQALALSTGGSTGPIKSPIMTAAKRRLQIESVASGSSSPLRALPVMPLTSPRRRHNAKPPVEMYGSSQLSSKLDSVLKSSSHWMRRKVVLGDESSSKQSPTRGGAAKTQHSPRRNSVVTYSHDSKVATGGGSDVSNNGISRDVPHHDLEQKVMAAFSRIVRMWRERKRRSEATTLTIMHGNKLRRDNGVESAHVVGILSRRMIREVPALQFFDVEPESSHSVVGPQPVPQPPIAVSASRSTPRGVCYTLDADGCRSIKMKSGALRASRMNQRDHRHRTSEAVTIEKAMNKTLRRKMAKRVKTKRQEICKLTNEFHKSRLDRSMKLQAQLALRQAEGEKMFSKRLSLLLSDDTALPAYQAQKELYLARVRCRKAHLLERCQTLGALGALLQHVEARGDATGLDVAPSELHFLDLFRCVVEGDRVLTRLIVDGIRDQLNALDQQATHELFAILHRYASQ